MNDYVVANLVKEVKVVLDQNMDSSTLQGLQDVDTLSLEEIIKDRLVDAARIVELSAAHDLLGEGKIVSPNSLVPGEIPEYLVASKTFAYTSPAVTVSYGEIELPSDYLRLVSLHVNGLPLAAIEAISETDPRYTRLYSRYAGIRGTWQRPVVVVSHNENGEHVLKVFPHGTNNRVITYAYVPLPAIVTVETVEKINICERLKDAIVYYTAFLVATIVEKDAAAPLLATAKELAGVVA